MTKALLEIRPDAKRVARQRRADRASSSPVGLHHCVEPVAGTRFHRGQLLLDAAAGGSAGGNLATSFSTS